MFKCVHMDEKQWTYRFDKRFLTKIGRLNPPRNIFQLSDVFAPAFQILFHLRHELVGNGTVDQSMIVTEREVNDAADRDRVVTIFVGDHERHFRDSTDAHDGGVWLIDDGQAEDGPELAGICDGEG